MAMELRTAVRKETAPRWQGTAGRLEVWYATFTEPDGTGWWIHYERLAPVDGPAWVHGWAALFRPGEAPVVERFGPTPPAGDLLTSGACSLAVGRMTGRAGRLAWDLALSTEAPSLYTFPRWAWEREVLPGAQIVDLPAVTVTGTAGVDGESRPLEAAGAQAHIFSQANASRWAWLHADLGGGDICELVAAVPHLPLGLHVPPRPVLRLRLDRYDSPRDSLLACILGRATAELPSFRATVPLGARRRVQVRVELAADASVQLQYPNPDGTYVYCTNSERADARIWLERRKRGYWSVERDWELDGTAHAEVGLSEPWDAVPVTPFTPFTPSSREA